MIGPALSPSTSRAWRGQPSPRSKMATAAEMQAASLSPCSATWASAAIAGSECSRASPIIWRLGWTNSCPGSGATPASLKPPLDRSAPPRCSPEGYTRGADTPEKEQQASAIAEAVTAAQQPLLDRMWDTPATTWAGLRAKAASATLWAPDLLESIDGSSDGGMIVVSILRDPIGGTLAAAEAGA
jgi:hypothetical protein